MIAGILNHSTIPYLSETVQFAQARHNVLVGNIANLDTPGYKTRDMSVSTFQARLAEAIEAHKTAEPSLGTLTGAGDESDPLRQVRDSMNGILRHDDVNVGMEQQVLEISKNQYLHNLAITIMGNQFQLLQTVISERV